MTNHTITIFEKSYVNFQRIHDKNVPTGYMTHYDTKAPAAFQKRKDAIDRTVEYRGAKLANMNGVIIDNKPMIGFRISRSLRSLGWASNSSSIRIEDPRGFEVEISIPNMIMLTDNNLLENGEILRACVWGRDGNTNVLLPINSQPYMQAVENTERINSHVNVRTINPGDSVILKNGFTGMYMGSLYSISWDQSGGNTSHYGSARSPIIKTIQCASTKYHYIRMVEESGRVLYYGYKSLSASSITNRSTMPPDEINLMILADITANNVIIVSPGHGTSKCLTTNPANVVKLYLTPINWSQLDTDYNSPALGRSRDTFFGYNKNDPTKMYECSTSNLSNNNPNSRRYISNIGYVADAKIYGVETSIKGDSLVGDTNNTAGFDRDELDIAVLTIEINISKLNQTITLTK